MATPVLTGGVRHRALSRLFRRPLLVVQVEEVSVRDEGEDLPRPHGRPYWRDATLEDLHALNRRQEHDRMQAEAAEAIRSAMRGRGQW